MKPSSLLNSTINISLRNTWHDINPMYYSKCDKNTLHFNGNLFSRGHLIDCRALCAIIFCEECEWKVQSFRQFLESLIGFYKSTSDLHQSSLCSTRFKPYLEMVNNFKNLPKLQSKIPILYLSVFFICF